MLKAVLFGHLQDLNNVKLFYIVDRIFPKLLFQACDYKAVMFIFNFYINFGITLKVSDK